jgi:quercetin dioxygenase-like cupin family protein
MSIRSAVFGLALISLLVCLATLRSQQPHDLGHDRPERMELFAAKSLEWQPGPPSLPKGAMMARLEGDPAKEGAFLFRLKLPDGYRVPPHTHPKTERVTVIAGTFNIGMGEKFDETATRAMEAGDYGYWAAGMKHFVWTKGETILQFHGYGPWSIRYLNPDDDPRNASK